MHLKEMLAKQATSSLPISWNLYKIVTELILKELLSTFQNNHPIGISQNPKNIMISNKKITKTVKNLI